MNNTKTKNKNEKIRVEVCSFTELQQLDYSLGLDNYQRPYVWGETKIRQLIDDLLAFQAQEKDSPDYYMGTLLLHQNDKKEKMFVIDGQQRLTSLCVLYHALKKRGLPERVDFHYRSAISVANIQRAHVLMQGAEAKKIGPSIFNRLCFTLIRVKNEDLAFTFFDTQNNRGVPLKATDLLKAFHLRAIHSSDAKQDENLQQHCARRWESIQVTGEKGKPSKENDFAPQLFHYYLWRARNWRGQKVIERETQNQVLESFQYQSIKSSSVAELPLYPGMNNRFASSLTLQANDEYQLSLQEQPISSSAAILPFALRQPIHQGVGFFLYAQKYATLINQLLHEDNPGTEIAAFRRFYQEVVMTLSHYLRELYKLAVLMYVDQFGTEQLLRFGLWLDHVFGAIRLEKKYIFKEAPLKFLKEADNNLLDVIAGAYRPDEVINFLKADTQAKTVYKGDKAAEVNRNKGVQGYYLNAVLNFYQKDSLDNKEYWMDEYISKEQNHG